MRILCIGDVVGSVGCEFLRKRLPSLKKLKGIDFVICNGENSADGNGITKASVEYLFQSGVDVITTGNHSFRRRESYELYDECEYLVRPANYPKGTTPGRGMTILDMGRLSVAVINLIGTAYMEAVDCPFRTADELIAQAEKENAGIIIVDFHAESTGEKRAMGYYLDGKVSVVAGTHTHVQTADEEILPCGTGYITDCGMCGARESILGMNIDASIKRLAFKLPAKYEPADGPGFVCGIIFETDRNGRCTEIKRFCEYE